MCLHIYWKAYAELRLQEAVKITKSQESLCWQSWGIACPFVCLSLRLSHAVSAVWRYGQETPCWKLK